MTVMITSFSDSEIQYQIFKDRSLNQTGKLPKLVFRGDKFILAEKKDNDIVFESFHSFLNKKMDFKIKSEFCLLLVEYLMKLYSSNDCERLIFLVPNNFQEQLLYIIRSNIYENSIRSIFIREYFLRKYFVSQLLTEESSEPDYVRLLIEFMEKESRIEINNKIQLIVKTPDDGNNFLINKNSNPPLSCYLHFLAFNPEDKGPKYIVLNALEGDISFEVERVKLPDEKIEDTDYLLMIDLSHSWSGTLELRRGNDVISKKTFHHPFPVYIT